MKVIDLLNKLANGEVPKKIKYDNDIYEYNKDYQDYGYFNTGIDRYITLIENELNSVFNLNEEVEIIEDTPKEKLTVSEEQMLFNNLDSIDRERIIQLMKILQPPKANVVISIDYSSCGE